MLSTGAVLVAPLGTAARTRAGGMVLEVSGLGAGLELAVAACGGMRCRHQIHTRATLREGKCTCRTGRAVSGLPPCGLARGPVAGGFRMGFEQAHCRTSRRRTRTVSRELSSYQLARAIASRRRTRTASHELALLWRGRPKKSPHPCTLLPVGGCFYTPEKKSPVFVLYRSAGSARPVARAVRV